MLAGEEAIQWMLREYAGRKLKASWFAWSRTGFEASYVDGLDLELVAPGEAMAWPSSAQASGAAMALG